MGYAHDRIDLFLHGANANAVLNAAIGHDINVTVLDGSSSDAPHCTTLRPIDPSSSEAPRAKSPTSRTSNARYSASSTR